MNSFQKIKSINIKLYFLIFSFVLSSAYIISDSLLFDNPVTAVAIKNAEKKTLERQTVVKHFLDNSKTLLHAINESPDFQSYIQNNANQSAIENVFRLIAKSTYNLMQIRYLDKNGQEIIRVDKSKSADLIQLIAQEKLQNKSHRYYFQKSKLSKPNQVWFSALDLNFEYGKLETPYKPTLRSILPIENNGDFGGILIINYYMQPFIEKLLNMPLYSATLINHRGDILIHHNPEKSWSKYQTTQDSLKNEYPDHYQQILRGNTAGDGSFFYRKFDLPIQNGLGVILKLSPNFLAKQEQNAFYQKSITFGLILLFSTLFSFVLAAIFQKYLTLLNTLNETMNETSKIAKIGFWESGKKQQLGWSEGTYDIFEIDDKHNTPITYQKFLSYLPEDEQKILNDKFVESVKQQTPFYIKHKIKTEKGNIRYLEGRAKHYYSNHGDYIKTLGSVIDITERKEKDELLQTQKNELETIFNTALEGIGLIDHQANYLKVNQKYSDILGYSEEELLHSSCLNLTHPDYAEEAKEILNKAIKNGSYENYERTCITKNGELRQLNSSYSLMPDGKSILVTTEDYTELREAENKLIENSYTDELTQLKNRKAFKEKSLELHALFDRYRQTYSFIIFDIDNFKNINDRYGHHLGDIVLIQISQLLSKTIRETDGFYRIGGEEFVVLAPEIGLEDSQLLAEKIRKAVYDYDFPEVGKVTISIGVAEITDEDKNIDSIFLRADSNLYKAKESGKNQVCS